MNNITNKLTLLLIILPVLAIAGTIQPFNEIQYIFTNTKLTQNTTQFQNFKFRIFKISFFLISTFEYQIHTKKQI